MPSAYAQEEARVLAKYEPFINKVAHDAFVKYGHIFRLDMDDFAQEGRLALIQAMRKIDWKFSSRQINVFLCGKIKHRMIDFIRTLDSSRANSWRKHGERIDIVLGDKTDYFDSFVSGGQSYPVVEMLNLIERINAIKSPRDRQVVLMAIQGYDNNEISVAAASNIWGQRNIHPSRIAQILKASGLFCYNGKTGKATKRVK